MKSLDLHHPIPCTVAAVLICLGPSDSSIELSYHYFTPYGDKRRDDLASTLPLFAFPGRSNMCWDEKQALAKGRDASHTFSSAVYDCGAISLGTRFRAVLETEISCIVTAQYLSGQPRLRRLTWSLLFGSSELVHDDFDYLPICVRSPRFCCQSFVVQHDSRILSTIRHQRQPEIRFSAAQGYTLLTIACSGLSDEVYHPTTLGRRIGRNFERLAELDIGLFPLDPYISFSDER